MRKLRIKFHKWRWGVFEREANRMITGPRFNQRLWEALMDSAHYHFNKVGDLVYA